jgi:predicted O-linked N-acetylglucosamine transferase (SPINDLY family)
MPKDFSLALEKVSNARFDVLHYWEIGTDAFNYFLALSKPSKIQCCSWGWPTTSGMKEVDYFISSRHLETEQGEKYYTEKLIRFNRLPVFYYRPPVPVPIKSRTSYNLPEEVPLYLCQQNLRKVHPDFDLVIDKILKKDSKGIILFIEDKQESITAILKKRLEAAAGDNSGRIIFMKRMEEGEYLGLLTHASVALDTFHYGGGANTTYDAFECGTPLITMPSEMHKGRFAYAAYQQMGMNDCIAKTADDYVDLAVNIANNSELRKKIVSAIQDKQTEIFEDKNAVKELSDFFISVCNSLAK